MKVIHSIVFIALNILMCFGLKAQQKDWQTQTVGRTLSAHGQLILPAGETLELTKGDRVMNLAFAHKKTILVVKTNRRLSIIDAKNFKVINHVSFPEGKEIGSMNGLAVAPDDSTFYVTGLEKNLYVGTVNRQGHINFKQKIDLSDGKKVNPLGIALSATTALVALAVSNEVAFVDLQKGKVIKKIAVGVCPYGVIISGDGSYAFVSNFGGPHPKAGDRTEKSAGSDVAVDERSVALRGSVSVIDIATKKVIKDIEVRIHPEFICLSPDGALLYVVDESGDGISVIDAKTFKVKNEINTKPDKKLPYGSLTSALSFQPDGKVLFAANAGNNAVGLIDPQKPQNAPYGFIAAGGFPGAIISDATHLFIGNVTPLKAGLQKVAIPKNKNELANYTAIARKGFHQIDIMRSMALANSKVRPKPVPDKAGEPSTIKHVVYIIRENKKYDQVFGGIGKGNSEPGLVEFGRDITPNAHALADNYVLLDNYYCNGINSSDGHQWAIQGITTPYHEKDFSNGHCAYDFGTDPLSYAGCGFIWDHLLRKGISFRNFGETDLTKITKGPHWMDQYKAWKNKDSSATFECVYNIKSLEKYSDLRYPGWNMNIPDQVRADAFLTALKEYEHAGSLPEFIIIYLPNDHTSGYSENSPTPRAYVADNDLATGRIMEALAKSQFWKDMVVFINEDDPQSGTDHVDGHRSLCMVAGPYVKKNVIISNFYNQASVLHTICRIFGVQPMNQTVAMAPVMSACFQNHADLGSPYLCLKPKVALDEMNPAKDKIKSKTTARLAPLTQGMDFSKPDLIDKEALIFSEYIWSTIHDDKPFPKEFFGAHGKGLRKLGLQIAPEGAAEN